VASDDLDRIEGRLVERVAGPWSRQVDAFRKATLTLYHARGGRLTAAELRALLAKVDLPGAPSKAQVRRLLVEAAKVGDARVKAKTTPHLGDRPAAAIAGAAKKPAAAVAETRRRATGVGDVDNLADLLGVLGPLGRSVGEMTGAASWSAMTAANEATVSAAAQAGAKLVFVPERDACVECQGRGGDTGKAAVDDPPPIHPNCRCELEEYVDEAVPRALKREGVRSVLRGFSLPSESEAARLRAAKELLRKKPAAPASVIAYAQRAVRAGKFPRGKNLP
jgi:hypothetical protein